MLIRFKCSGLGLIDDRQEDKVSVLCRNEEIEEEG